MDIFGRVSIHSRLHPPTDSVPADRNRVDCPFPEGKGYRKDRPGAVERQVVFDEVPVDEVPVMTYGVGEVMGGLNWYQAQYRSSLKSLLVLSVALCVAVCLCVFLVVSSPEPKYFASSPDGHIVELVPLSRPVMSDAGLLNWTAETTTSTLALDFLHWRDKLTAMRPNFTPEAYRSFLQSLKETGVITMIEGKRLSVSAVVSRAPVITASGIAEDGKMAWRIEVPLIVSYESSKGVESTQHLLATVLVRREDTAATPKGVAIQQIVLVRDTYAP
jgi:intracellular multiplication protein IcmL